MSARSRGEVFVCCMPLPGSPVSFRVSQRVVDIGDVEA